MRRQAESPYGVVDDAVAGQPSAPCLQEEPATLLDLVVAQATEDATASPRLSALAGEPSLASAVRYYAERVGEPPGSKDDLIGLLSRDIAA